MTSMTKATGLAKVFACVLLDTKVISFSVVPWPIVSIIVVKDTMHELGFVCRTIISNQSRLDTKCSGWNTTRLVSKESLWCQNSRLVSRCLNNAPGSSGTWVRPHPKVPMPNVRSTVAYCSGVEVHSVGLTSPLLTSAKSTKFTSRSRNTKKWQSNFWLNFILFSNRTDWSLAITTE